MKPVKITIGILVVASLGVAVWLSKPEGDNAKTEDTANKRSSLDKDSQTKKTTSALNEHPSKTDGAENTEHRLQAKRPELTKEELRAQAQEVADMLRSLSTKKSANGPSAKEHEDSAATVRPVVAKGLIGKTNNNRTQGTPVWSSPSLLNWAQLRRLHLGWVLAQNAGQDFNEDTVRSLNGAAVTMTGAVMPIDPVPANGEMKRFWLAHPRVVGDGCVFCNPPTLGDLVYISTDKPFVVDRENLYKSTLQAEITGQFELGPSRTPDRVEYLFGIKLKEIRIISK